MLRVMPVVWQSDLMDKWVTPEVGHINIGAGRIVYQELTRITKEIQRAHFENVYCSH